MFPRHPGGIAIALRAILMWFEGAAFDLDRVQLHTPLYRIVPRHSYERGKKLGEEAFHTLDMTTSPGTETLRREFDRGNSST
jgi:hypothetical protein